MEKSKVYFSNKLDSNEIVKLFECLGIKLEGKVGVKVHSGEKGNQNYLRPEFFVPIVKHVNGTIIECNTAYSGARNSTEKHLKLIEEHEWTKYFDVDIMDENKDDIELEIKDGLRIKKDFVGGHLNNYDSILVLSHFKGHPMGGYGGALKQLSIGFASSRGKAYIHSVGKTKSQKLVWALPTKHDEFLESMADAASAVAKKFKGRIAYINVMANMSVDCDCCEVAEDPCLKDVGILASLDPIAIDRACLDLVKNSNDPGKEHFLERVNSRNGEHTIEAAINRDFGTIEYELIDINK